MRIRHEAKLSASIQPGLPKKKRRDKLVIPEQLILTGRDLSQCAWLREFFHNKTLRYWSVRQTNNTKY